MTWTAPRTWGTSEVVSAAIMNQHVRDNLLHLRGEHGVRLTKSATQSINSGANTAVSWDQETYDTDGFHDNVTNNSRITIPAGFGGYYEVRAQNAWAGNATGVRKIIVTKNGTANLLFGAQGLPAAASVMTVYAAGRVNLAAGDFLEVVVFQSSGGALNVTIAGGAIGDESFFEAHHVGT